MESTLWLTILGVGFVALAALLVVILGDPTPATEDLQATERLRSAARLVGLRFLDHVIVAQNRWARVN